MKNLIFLLLCFMGLIMTALSVFTLPKDCGTSKVSPSLGDRIVGGREVLRGEFPWQVSLRYKTFFISSTHLCGAVLLNQWWVVTAAHCVSRRSKSNLGIVVGLHSQRESFVSYSVDKLVVHSMFDPVTFLNDIALLKVKKPLPVDEILVNAVCLPLQEASVEGIVTVSGWGATYENGTRSSVLMTVDLPVIPPSTCEGTYGKDDYSTSAMFCAGYSEGGRDTCQGDSGGPVVQRSIEGRSVLVGLVSSGVGCARPNLPGIYTRISHFVDWIHGNTD